MGGGSSRQRSRRRVTFKDEQDDDEESYDHYHPDGDPDGRHREESTTSLGQRIIQRARNDRTPPPSQPTQRQRRGPVVILIRDPKTGQIRRATSFPDKTESKTTNPEEAKPPTPPPPPPQETVDKRRKHRPNKPVMSFDLWGDPVLGPDVESIAPPPSTTSSSLPGGSFMARKEYDRQLAMKRQNQRKELQPSVSESDVRSTSTQRLTPVELYPAIRHRGLAEDFEDDSETIGASQVGVEHNQSLLRRPGGQAQHPSSRDRDSRKKPPYEILSERKRKKKIPRSDQVSYQQLSHGFSSTSEQFSQNVSRKTIPSTDDSQVQDIQTY